MGRPVIEGGDGGRAKGPASAGSGDLAGSSIAAGASGGIDTGRREAGASSWISPELHRVGILGGTFDPIHYGHLAIAEQVAEALHLDRVLFVPASLPPHKLNDEIAPAADRAAMIALAIADNPMFGLCRIELERDGPSYTADTLQELADEAARQRVARELYFILSAEAVAALPTWRTPARILELARLVVVPRPGFPMPDPDALATDDRIQIIDTVRVAISSTEVRARAAAGQSIRYLVPPAVEAYIREHRLYRSQKHVRTA